MVKRRKLKPSPRVRDRVLTPSARAARLPAGTPSLKRGTRSIGARVTIPVFEMIDAAASFTNVPRSRIVEDGATAWARDIIARHTTLLEKHKRRMREERRARRPS